MITTGESTIPRNWSVKRGETTDKKTNQHMQAFREEIEQGYNTLLYKYGAVSAELLKQGKSYSFIAETIGVATSTVSREIRRNQTPRGRYSCRQAETYASERKEWRYYPRKFNSKMRHEVEQIIRQQQWSPEQIVGRFRLEGIPIVGKTTLYTFLHKDKESGGDLYRHTRHHLKYRHKPLASPQKGKWGRRKSIDERPDCIDRKERFGNFEMDLIIGAHQREAILTLTERKGSVRKSV